jgi:hypothetical protein
MLIVSWYNQNSDTYLEPNLWGWNAGFLVVKPAQLQRSGFLYVRARCNSLVPGWNPTWNRPGNMQLFVTLPSSDCFQVLVQTRWTTACQLTQSRPPSVSFQIRLITASKCSSKLAWSRPPTLSPNSCDHNLGVLPQIHSITTSKCVWELTW